jgi:hypothetical protein
MTYAAAVIVIATLVAMTSGTVGPVLALLVALIAAGVLGTAPADELFAGLSNPGVITVAGMLVIAKGVVQTGVVSRLTWGLLSATRTARQAFRRLVVPLGVAVRKSSWSGRSRAPLRSCAWVRVTDGAKRRRQGLVACRAALPFEGLRDARPGGAPAPVFW